MIQKHSKDYKFIEGLMQNDYKIIEEIYSKYSKAIVKLVCQNNGTKDDAKDVIQESLIIIYQKAKKENFVLTSNFFTFFYGVCRNVWWRTLKKNKYKTTGIEGEIQLVDDIDISKEINMKERYQFYLKKLNELSDGCRQILQLHFDGKKMKEIVEIMGLSSVNYGSKRKHKCKARLIDLIETDIDFSEFKL
jgi:RNA polymerase sigma factor (sigma-70 family)